MTVDEMKEKKRQLGYSSEKLAELSGVPLGTVQKIFGGFTKAPRYKTLQSLEKVFAEDIDPEKYIEEHGLKSDNDEDALRATIEQIVKDNPQSVEDYHNGKEKAIGFLVGQTMKATKGKANPGMVNKILKELL